MVVPHLAGRSTAAACIASLAAGAARAQALPLLAALLGLLLLLDAPVWLVTLASTPTGATLLDRAGGLAEPAIALYQWSPRVDPGSAVGLLLAGLSRMTGSALATDALFLSLYGLLWIGATYAASRAETDRPMLPTLLLLPLAYGTAVHKGSYDLALGVPGFLLFSAFWRGLDHRRDLLALTATACLLLVLGQTHVAALAAACLLPLADGLERGHRVLLRYGPRAGLRTLAMAGAWTMAAALPALLFVADDPGLRHGLAGAASGLERGYARIVGRIASETCLSTSSDWEVLALAPLLAALAFAGVTAVRAVQWSDRLWPIVLMLVLCLSACDLASGGGAFAERLAPFAWIALVLTIASRQPSLLLVRAACVAAVLGLAGQSTMRVIAYRAWPPIEASAAGLGPLPGVHDFAT